jgi:phosphoglycolate phosphatase-like HAD superfamily hydrolase
MHTNTVQPLTEIISNLDNTMRHQVLKTWDKAELTAAPNVTINKKGIEIYNSFEQKPKALVTMQGKAVVKNILARLKISFNFTVTREDSLNRREQLENAAGKLKSRFDNILFVADTEHDFFAAKKVGCGFLRVNEFITE